MCKIESKIKLTGGRGLGVINHQIMILYTTSYKLVKKKS